MLRRRASTRPLQRQRSDGYHTALEHAQEDRPMEETGRGPTGMMTQTQLEERLLAAETALKEIQRRLATLPPAPNWLDEVIAFGRAFREAQPYPDDPGAPVPQR